MDERELFEQVVDDSLDPWMGVEVLGAPRLFGYVHRLECWRLTSALVTLDEGGMMAVTRSGTMYGLGREVVADDLPPAGVVALVVAMAGLGKLPTAVH